MARLTSWLVGLVDLPAPPPPSPTGVFQQRPGPAYLTPQDKNREMLSLGDHFTVYSLLDVKEKHYVRLQFTNDVQTIPIRHIPLSHAYLRLEEYILQLVRGFNQAMTPHMELFARTLRQHQSHKKHESDEEEEEGAGPLSPNPHRKRCSTSLSTSKGTDELLQHLLAEVVPFDSDSIRLERTLSDTTSRTSRTEVEMSVCACFPPTCGSVPAPCGRRHGTRTT